MKRILSRLVRAARRQSDHNEDGFYRSLTEQMADVVLKVDANGKVRYASPSAFNLLGYAPDRLIGRDPLFTILPDDLPVVRAAMKRLESGEVRQASTQVRSIHADGRLVWTETMAQASESNDGSVVIVLRDITERKRLEEELASLALQDGLTGLANRRSFDQVLEREWQRTVREQTELALLLIDVDNFKRFNDEYGHRAGDDCLRSIAHAIRTALWRPGDLACRYGGEEIAVILPRTDRAGAAETAERVRAAIASLEIPHLGNSAAHIVTASIGLATAMARHGGTNRMPEGLLLAADHALYRAKHEGRNRVSESLLLIPSSADAPLPEAQNWANGLG